MSGLCTLTASTSSKDDAAASGANVSVANTLVKTLTKQDETRLANLNAALEAVLRARSHTSTLIKKALTATQFQSWKRDLLAPQSADELLTQDAVPAELQDYGRKVAKADFLFGKAERMAAMKQLRGYKFHSETITAAYQTAETAYEQTLERLQEILSKHTASNDLHIWLDRDVSFDFDTELSPEQHGIPRLRTSKSPYVLNPVVKTDKQLKRELVTLQALIQATSEIVYDAKTKEGVSINAADETKLDTLMAKLKAEIRELD